MVIKLYLGTERRHTVPRPRKRYKWIFAFQDLAAARHRDGLTPTALAKSLDPPKAASQIIDIETGRRSCTLDTFLEICTGRQWDARRFLKRVPLATATHYERSK